MPVAEAGPHSKWWRHACYDHPGYSQKLPGSIANPGVSSAPKPKVYCKACWHRRIELEEAKDQEEIKNLQRHTARSREAIEDYLWAFSAADNPPWMQGRTETILRHLASCPYVTEEMRRDAQREKEAKNLNKSPSRPIQSSQPSYSGNLPPQPLFYAPTMYSSDLVAGPSSRSYTACPVPTGSTPPTPLHSYSPAPLSSAYHHSPPPASQSPHPGPRTSPAPLLFLNQPCNSLSAHSTPQLSPMDSPRLGDLMGQSNKRRRISRQTSLTLAQTWSSAHQSQFEARIARMTASCGFPFRWIEDIEVMDFFAEYIPSAKLPSRRVVADRLVPSEVEKYRTKSKAECHGLLATLQYDGWSGGNFHHYLLFMMTTSNRTLHTVRVFDTSADRKTAVELIAKMKEVKELVESSEWNVTVIAVTGDAAGESRRARLDLGVLFPELLLPDCYGHQINLIVGDYFGVPYTLLLLDKADDATELITWLRSKTYVLAQVRVIQEVNHFQVLSVIQAVISRWTAHYLAFKRLLELRLPLEMMVRQDRLKDVSQICTGKRKAREKAERMFEVIEDPVFWHSVLRLKRHLEPLALAANITQLTHVRPDQVLVVFGLLYAEYQLVKDQDTDIETKILVDAIQASIEKRWAKTDQEVFIVALILNPLYKTKPFTYLDITTAAGLLELVKKLYRRFFGTLSADESHELFQELGDYLNGMGIYRNLENYAQDLVRQARELGEHLDPVKAWDGVRHLSRPRTPLQKLAHRIHSITTNSASCERLFSAFGTTLTRLRSRLRSKSMVDLAELRVHLRNEHVREGRVKARLKRKMTTHDDTTTDGADPATTNQVEPQLAIANADDDSPDEDIDQERAASASESGSLRSVATRHSHTEADEPSPQETINSRRIADIFDFTTDTWRQLAKEFALRGLNEEQEFYELVDLDAGGEDEETEELLNEVTQSALRV